MTGVRDTPLGLWLLAAFVILLAISAINPEDWQDFVIEHALTLLAIAGLVVLMRRPLSNLACTLIFAFLALHVLGAHYTYSKVPYDQWSQRMFGRSVSEIFHFQRNHYDRLVHLTWGLLLLIPMREMVERWFGLAAMRASVVAVALLATMSACYEMLEWLFTIVMSPEAAETYHGQQGDIFDAQKDAALALSGSIIAAMIVGVHSASQAARTGRGRASSAAKSA